MYVEQISIFLENKSGRLCEVTRVLSENNINICALCLADTIDFGILRLIVNDPTKAEKALKDNGFTVTKNNVLAVYMGNTPGSLHKVLSVFKETDVQVEYTYAFIDHDYEKAVVVLCIDNVEEGLNHLKNGGIEIVNPSEIYCL